MDFNLVILSVVCLGFQSSWSHEISRLYYNGGGYSLRNETSYKLYNSGIKKGIIDPEKYTFDSFLKDETNVFLDLYQTFKILNITEPISYEEWLAINHYGLIPETKESYFSRKINKRDTEDNKRAFVNIVEKGDILITGQGIGGLIGHAAIMTTDYWVLEMPGGPGWQNGIPDNNRQLSKHDWFEIHASDWTSVYRVPDVFVPSAAADWADHTYYNPTGGIEKTKHITYKLTPNMRSFNPSYSSKLVVQAYYFGTGSRAVIKSLSSIGGFIVPASIPSYFLSPYKPKFIGKF